VGAGCLVLFLADVCYASVILGRAFVYLWIVGFVHLLGCLGAACVTGSFVSCTILFVWCGIFLIKLLAV